MPEIRQYRTGDEENLVTVEDRLTEHPLYQKTWDEIIGTEWTWTGLSTDGQILAIGGLLPLKEDKAVIWLLVNKMAKKKTDILRVVKAGIRLLESYGFSTLYAHMKIGCEQGFRIVKYLGFNKVKLISADYWLYERNV